MQTGLDYRLDMYDIRLIPVTVPDKKDPDEFVLTEGPNAFVDLLRKSKERIVNGRP
jgi:DNA primase